MPEQQEASVMKVADLKPTTKQASLVAKVVNIGERRTIDSKFGEARELAEGVIGDGTGTVVLSLWEAQIDQVRSGDTLQVTNGYVSIVRGHIRLNVGKYGTLAKATTTIGEVSTGTDISAAEHERPEREFRGGSGGGGGAPGGSRFGGERREHGRRRF